jgi:hypothetical protein
LINCHNRYAKIISRNRELLNTNKSILEIGAGTNGIAPYLGRPATGIGATADDNSTVFLSLREDDILQFDFADNSYDYVLCVDTLEHIRPDLRATVIREMLRVTREGLIISCPCGRVPYNYDRHFTKILKSNRYKVPQWLSGHIKNGLPELSDIIKIIAELGKPFTVTGNEGITQHYAGLLLDIQFRKINRIYQTHKHKTCYSAPISSSEWDQYYSYLFEVNKKEHCNTSNKFNTNQAGENQNRIAVYSVFHQDIDASYLNNIIPIYAGSIAKQKEHAHLTDHLKNSPSLLNTRWSELSAIYKIWKEGPQTDVVGFTHYRRLFNFNRHIDTDLVVSPGTLKEIHSNDVFDYESICALGNKGICIAKPIELPNTIWEQYFHTHNTNDWCWVLSKLSRDYPHLMEHALEQSKSTSLYACNMFITKWSTFCELCSLWFDILLEFESKVDPERANNYQNRDISFLAERIFDIWIRYKKFSGEKIREIPIFFIEFAKDNQTEEIDTDRSHYTPERDDPRRKWSKDLLTNLKKIFVPSLSEKKSD